MNPRATILVIDDTIEARDAVEALLGAEGYVLEFAANGFEGLEKAARFMPDVILLDVMMPGLDGYETCRRLRATPATAEVPILLVTALDDNQSRLTGLSAGADDFISKPYNALELLARLQSITRLNRYRRLLTERNRLTWILEHTHDGYVYLDADERISYANPQACAYLGLTPNAWPSAEPFRQVAEKKYRLEPASAWAQWPRVMAGCYLVCPSVPPAPALWLELAALQLADSTASGHLLQLRDISAQLGARQDLRKFRKAVSHKLLVPLYQLYRGLEELLQRASLMSASETTEIAAQTMRSALRLHGETDNLFDYISAPVVALPSEGFALSALPARLAAISQALNLPAALVTLAPPLEALRLTLSSQSVDLILWELADNAKKYHPQNKPKLTVTVERTPAAQTVNLQFGDNGLTLAPEQLATLLQPDAPVVDPAAETRGLPLVAALTWQAGGQARITNRSDGPGLVVELTLPVA